MRYKQEIRCQSCGFYANIEKLVNHNDKLVHMKCMFPKNNIPLEVVRVSVEGKTTPYYETEQDVPINSPYGELFKHQFLTD